MHIQNAPATKPETLGDAIAAYWAGVAEFDRKDPADGEDEAVAEQTIYAPLGTLSAWDRPARTVDEAIAALRLAEDELTTFESPPVAKAMVSAALRRLELLATPALGQMDSWSLMRMASTLSAAHEVIDLQVVAASHVEFLHSAETWAESLTDFLREQMGSIATEVSIRPQGNQEEQRTREITLGRMVGWIDVENGGSK